ncbi:Pfs, NACHT and ankyrin domain protein, partial [Aureobasidium melanogenum]
MSSATVPPSAGDYTVAWIAALPRERAAGEMMLDQKFTQPEDFNKNANDPNSYSWGRMGKHLVVIASLPAGEYGTTTTAITAQGLRSSLPHIRVGLLVGIGAGVPGEICNADGALAVRRDIRLGDVVVSNPNGSNGGVVQYDLVKAKDSLERKGSLNSPPLALRSALSALQAEHEHQDSKISSIMNAAMEKFPKAARNYSRPTGTPDRLFRACCSHAGGEDCTNCDPAGQIKRTPREDPEVHCGTIACGNTLVKNAAHRDEIVSWLRTENVDPLCFEMEAAGLMNAFPCLVIRGICDYGDSHKNDAWQRYAAMTAAAFAKEYLGFVDVEEVRRLDGLHKVLVGIEGKVDDVIEGTQKIQSTLQSSKEVEERRSMINWLSPPDPSSNYHRTLDQRHSDTGRWFLESSAFKQWKADPKSFLWLHGIPGCGKTVLSSTIIEHLQQELTCRILVYFYFDFNDKNKQSFDNMLRSVILQVCQSHPDSWQFLRKAWESHLEGSRQPSTHSLQKVLQVMLNGIDNMSIVLDALDESESKPRDKLLAWLETLFEMNKDISIYIEHQVDNGHDLKRWRPRPDLQKEIKTKLTNKADGMFRWVACQIEILKDCLNQQDLRSALENLPETLDETYERILNEIPKNYRQRTMIILRLLTWSERPLRPEELLDAVAVQPDDRPSFDPNNRMPEAGDIMKICSSLVVSVRGYYKPVFGTGYGKNYIETEVTVLQLAHFSVKETSGKSKHNITLPCLPVRSGS